MCLSDPTTENDFEWKPLNPQRVEGTARESTADLTYHEFKLLYEASDTQDPADTFTPLYDHPSKKPPLSVEEDEAETETPSPPVETEPAPAAEDIRKKAYDEGVAEGEKKGFAEGKEKADGVVKRMQSLLSEMEEIWKRLIATYEQQIIQLICRTAEKVVYAHIAMDQDAIKQAILHAFQMIPEPVAVTIEVNADDAEYIETVKEDFFSQVKTLKHISVIPNPSVTCGGCLVKTEMGEVDATLETRLEAVRQTIIDVGRNKVENGPSDSRGL